jgi:hypothetical protein
MRSRDSESIQIHSAELSKIRSMASAQAEVSGKSRRYHPHLKQKVLDLLKRGVPISAIADSCRIPLSAIYYWKRAAKGAKAEDISTGPDVREFIIKDVAQTPTVKDSGFTLRGSFGRFRVDLSF